MRKRIALLLVTALAFDQPEQIRGQNKVAGTWATAAREGLVYESSIN